MALFDFAGEDRLQRVLLGIEDARRAGEFLTLLAGDLPDAAERREVAVEHHKMAALLDRVVEAVDHILVLRVRLHVLEIFREGLAGHGQAIAVEQALVEEHLHQRRHAANGHERSHDILAARLQVGQHRHAFTDAGEVVDGQFHARRVRDSEKVQHCVGRAAERDDHGDRVLERLLRHDVERADAELEQPVHCRAGVECVLFLCGRNCVLRGAVRQAHAQRLDRAGHGVGRVHATT